MLLDENGVEVYHESGDAFNAQRQRAIRVEKSPERALHEQIATRIRPGFQQQGELLQKEWVAVYAYEPSNAAEPPPATAVAAQTDGTRAQEKLNG